MQTVGTHAAKTGLKCRLHRSGPVTDAVDSKASLRPAGRQCGGFRAFEGLEPSACLVPRRPAALTGAIGLSSCVTLAAIADHLAHYLSCLLVAGQLIFPLASDPFGGGWDLFGTRDWKVGIDLIGRRFLWWASVVAIVTGHAIAVRVAHAQALCRLGAPGTALRSQSPMFALMVGYTAFSLRILAQPITEPSSG